MCYTKSTKKSEAKSLFKNIDEMNLHQYPYDKPGNMFFWMRYHTPADTTYLIWGDQDLNVDEKVIKVYEQLVSLSKQQQI